MGVVADQLKHTRESRSKPERKGHVPGASLVNGVLPSLKHGVDKLGHRPLDADRADRQGIPLLLKQESRNFGPLRLIDRRLRAEGDELGSQLPTGDEVYSKRDKTHLRAEDEERIGLHDMVHHEAGHLGCGQGLGRQQILWTEGALARSYSQSVLWTSARAARAGSYLGKGPERAKGGFGDAGEKPTLSVPDKGSSSTGLVLNVPDNRPVVVRVGALIAEEETDGVDRVEDVACELGWNAGPTPTAGRDGRTAGGRAGVKALTRPTTFEGDVAWDGQARTKTGSSRCFAWIRKEEEGGGGGWGGGRVHAHVKGIVAGLATALSALKRGSRPRRLSGS